MSTAFDLQATALARRMLARYGKAMTYTQRREGAYSAGAAALSTTSVSVRGLISSPSLLALRSDSVVQTGDQLVTVAAYDLGTIIPTPGDTITVGNAAWTVITASSLYSGEDIATYTLHVRR